MAAPVAHERVLSPLRMSVRSLCVSGRANSVAVSVGRLGVGRWGRCVVAPAWCRHRSDIRDHRQPVGEQSKEIPSLGRNAPCRVVPALGNPSWPTRGPCEASGPATLTILTHCASPPTAGYLCWCITSPTPTTPPGWAASPRTLRSRSERRQRWGLSRTESRLTNLATRRCSILPLLYLRIMRG